MKIGRKGGFEGTVSKDMTTAALVDTTENLEEDLGELTGSCV